ncbi:MAG: hypothetical protein WA634_01310 [Silvibacterium sp.]
MAASLERLLRLRSLVEETSRMELERRAALAARIDQAQQRERQNSRESRALALQTISNSSPSREQAQQRTMEWSNAESSAWREQQLEPLAQATARRVAEGREEFFERRKERRQVESVLDAERTRLRTEQERRTQRELDDWFGMKLARQSNRRRKAPQS